MCVLLSVVVTACKVAVVVLGKVVTVCEEDVVQREMVLIVHEMIATVMSKLALVKMMIMLMPALKHLMWMVACCLTSAIVMEMMVLDFWRAVVDV